MMLNGKPVDALAMIVHRSVAQTVGRAWTKKLSTSCLFRLLTRSGDVLPRQLFEVAIQAAIGTRVLARETLSAMRKDVTAGLYGGEYLVRWYYSLLRSLADSKDITRGK